MAYKGIYKIINKEKYVGNPDNVWYRSLWERAYMLFLDNHPSVIKWSSEELAIPYFSHIDKKTHRYFPDFVIEVAGGKKYIIEIKPKKYTVPPKKISEKNVRDGRKYLKRKRRYLKETQNYNINTSKWNAAIEYAKKTGMEFKIITEKDIFDDK